MKTAKVIATCFNPKEIVEKTRLTGEPLGYFYHSQKFTNTNEIINLLKLNIELENKFNPGCDRDLIIVNADIGSDDGNEFIKNINNTKINRGKIISYTRKNFGLSFGSYNDAFDKFKDKYDYFLFTEDDWIIINDNYLKVGIDILNKDPSAGMIAYVGVTKVDESRWKMLNLNKKTAFSCHGGIGLSSSKILKTIFNKFGSLPHYDKSDYKKSVTYGEIMFPNSFIQLGYKLVDLPNDSVFGMPAYDYMRKIKYKKFPNFFDLIVDYYYKNSKAKLGKIIWNIVSVNSYLKNFYLKLIKFLKN